MDFEASYPLLDFDSFNARFEVLIPDFKNLARAYEAVEKEVEALYNHRKYSSYETFQVCRSRYFKRKSNQHNQKPRLGHAA